MFEIEFSDAGQVVMRGRLDAARAEDAQRFLDAVAGECVIDMGGLEYISSAGLGILLRTHKRLMAVSAGVRLVNVNHHIGDIFRYSGFDRILAIEAAR